MSKGRLDVRFKASVTRWNISCLTDNYKYTLDFNCVLFREEIIVWFKVLWSIASKKILNIAKLFLDHGGKASLMKILNNLECEKCGCLKHKLIWQIFFPEKNWMYASINTNKKTSNKDQVKNLIILGLVSKMYHTASAKTPKRQ